MNEQPPPASCHARPGAHAPNDSRANATTSAYLASIVESSNDSIVSLDLQKKFTTWNAAAERLYGYSAEEAIGKPMEMLALPEDVALLFDRLDEIIAEGNVATFEMIRLHKDQHEMWLAITLSPVRDASGAIIGVSTIARDVTERRRLDEELRRTEEQFRRAIEDAPTPVIMHAEDGEVLTISRSWTELTGYTLQDMPTVDAWLTRAYGGGADDVRDHVRRLFLQEFSIIDEEIVVKAADGSERCWSFSSSAPGCLRDGRRFIVGMAVDITERRKLEKAWREGEERLRLVVESAREYAIISLGTDRSVQSWNSGAQAILGYAEHEILGQSADIIFTPEDRAAGSPEQEIATALTEGRAAEERWYMRKDGSRFWGRGVVSQMRSHSGETVGFVKVFRDRTAEQAAQQALAQSHVDLSQSLQENQRVRAELEAAASAKDHLLAVLSHELRTPLTPVILAVEVLARRKDLIAEVRDVLDMIRRNLRIEAQFVDDLLDVTRITSGKLEVDHEPFDAHRAITHAVEISRCDLEGRNQRFVVALEAEKHQVKGDPTRLQQAVWNLLKNASKFTPASGAISCRTYNEDRWLVIEVSDTGIGIEAGALERIFNPFEQANPGVTQQYGGLGLGLAITKATVEAQGGHIRVRSEGTGRGATFSIALPNC